MFNSRIWDIAVGLVMIALSAIVQMFFLMFLSFGMFGILEVSGVTAGRDTIGIACSSSIMLIFNIIAFYEYFRRRRMAVLGSAVHKFKAIAEVDSKHIAFVIFLVPRAMDRICFGRELAFEEPIAGSVLEQSTKEE